VEEVGQEKKSGDKEKKPRAGMHRVKVLGKTQVDSRPSEMSDALSSNIGAPNPNVGQKLSLRDLLQAGVHFGHQTSRWHPAMQKFIFTARNGIHVIDLPKTVDCWSKAEKIIVETTSKGGSVLFIATKKQAQEVVKQEAERSGSYYVCRRWLGGMMTNFSTIRKSIDRMKQYETVLAEEETAIKEGRSPRYKKKERLLMSKDLAKLNNSLGGIRDMHSLPSLVFIVDIRREDIAVSEASKLGIPIVALVDTNCDPAHITHPVPCNDDGTRAIKFFAQKAADAVLEGKRQFQSRSVSVSREKSSGGVEGSLLVDKKGEAHKVSHAQSNTENAAKEEVLPDVTKAADAPEEALS